jgi:hypothetical protein
MDGAQTSGNSNLVVRREQAGVRKQADVIIGEMGRAGAVTLECAVSTDENRYSRWHPVRDSFSIPFIGAPAVTDNGHAFGFEPAVGAFPGQDPVSGFEGERLVNSKRRNLGTYVGELRSDPFTIRGDRIDFLIGGGDFAGVTCINLLVRSDPWDVAEGALAFRRRVRGDCILLSRSEVSGELLTYEAEVAVLTGEAAGLVLRAGPTGKPCYAVLVSALAQAIRVVSLPYPGADLCQIAQHVELGRTYSLRVVCEVAPDETRLTVYLDGALRLTWADSVIRASGNAFGVITSDSTARFRRLGVSESGDGHSATVLFQDKFETPQLDRYEALGPATSGYEVVRTATGERNNVLARRGWDVSGFTGQRAELQILDYAPVEKWGFNASPCFAEDDWGFILIDDIRQTDKDGNRVCEAYDLEHNFNFERLEPWAREVRPGPIRNVGPAVWEQEVRIGESGVLSCRMDCRPAGPNLVRVLVEFAYSGATVSGAKIEMRTTVPVSKSDTQYCLFPGVLFDGNRTAEACHYWGEDFPEDTLAVPGCCTIEDAECVVGVWTAPQRSGCDPLTSVRIEPSGDLRQQTIVHSIPDSFQFGRRMLLDRDARMTLTDGLKLRKELYAYIGAKRQYSAVPNEKQGYLQVLQSAWDAHYPESPANPPHSLQRDFALHARALLDPKCVMNDIVMNGRTYRVPFVARWILGDLEISGDVVPKEYFHRYVGFSWSGMIGLGSYTALQEHIRNGNREALRLAVDSLDLFAENGMSSIGVLYPTYHDGLGGMVGFGTYFDPGNIDMGPLGEALYWYCKCAALCGEHGICDKPLWLDVARRSLDNLIRLYPDGDIPGRINGTSGGPAVRSISLLYWERSNHTSTWWRPADIEFGRPSQRGPTGFANIALAAVELFRVCNERAYLDYAEAIGHRLIDVIVSFGTLAGGEMDFYNIDKRAGLMALAALNALYETTGEEKWLEGAQLAAGWFAAWQYCYNVCFDGYEHLPLGRFDYRTVGGQSVDHKYSTNNSAFSQGAHEWARLWRFTGDVRWFERARALLHQGTQTTLDEPKLHWLNEHYQGPADSTIASFNPRAQFDRHCVGNTTEDVLPSGPSKGHWTTKPTAIVGMYAIGMGLDTGNILDEFGSITYSHAWRWAGALDTVEVLSCRASERSAEIDVRNMLGVAEEYGLRVLDWPGTIEVDGTPVAKGVGTVAMALAAHERRTIRIALH